MKAINERYRSFMPHFEHHSVDENMVPYFGRHGTKQFIRGKPIRYSFIFWCGGTNTGYLSWLEPYQRAGTLPAKYNDKGLGYSAVSSYIDQLDPHPYKLYFDNLLAQKNEIFMLPE